MNNYIVPLTLVLVLIAWGFYSKRGLEPSEIAAAVALLYSAHAARKSEEANILARESNTIAETANNISLGSLKHQKEATQYEWMPVLQIEPRGTSCPGGRMNSKWKINNIGKSVAQIERIKAVLTHKSQQFQNMDRDYKMMIGTGDSRNMSVDFEGVMTPEGKILFEITCKLPDGTLKDDLYEVKI